MVVQLKRGSGHLPSVEELLRGMAFFSNDVLDDAAE